MSYSNIQQWLNSKKDYNVGVALFKTHINDEQLNKVFAQGFSDYRHKRLITALSELVNNNANTAPKEPKYEAVTHGEQQLPEQAANPKTDPYREQWMPHYMAMQNLCARLREFPNDIERGKAAFEILRLERICQEYWQKADYYRNTGTHMPEPPETKLNLVTDPNVYVAKLMLVRSSISKTKKKLSSDPDNQKLLAKLEKLIAERDFINKQLDK